MYSLFCHHVHSSTFQMITKYKIKINLQKTVIQTCQVAQSPLSYLIQEVFKNIKHKTFYELVENVDALIWLYF